MNYMLGGESPVTMAMKGYSQGLSDTASRQSILSGAQNMDVQLRDEGRANRGLDQADRGLAQADRRLGQGDRVLDQADRGLSQADAQLAMQQEAQAYEMEQARALQQDLSALISNPAARAEDYAAVAIKHPQMADGLTQGWELMSKPRQEADALRLAQVHGAIEAGNIDVAERLLTEHVEGLRNAGQTQDADMAEAVLETLREDPATAKMMTGLTLSIVGGSKFDRVLNAGREAGVQSASAIGDAITIFPMDNGSVRVVDNATGETLTGQAATDAIAASRAAETDNERIKYQSRREGTLGGDINLGGEAAASVAAGSEAVDRGTELFDQYGIVKSGINLMDDGIAAIDSGAKSGALDKFKIDTTEASARLRITMNKLGLNVLQMVTFGALSEKELGLALETGVPQNLNEAELRAWFVRQKAAQEQVAAAMLDQAQFLLTPGNTTKMWIDMQSEKAAGRGPVAPAAADATAQPAPMGGADMMSMGDFNAYMNELGGN
jgi:hypothetical protein